MCRFCTCLKCIPYQASHVKAMFEGSCGKLLVYASSFSSREKRLKPVSSAAEKMAKLLKLNVEVVTFRKRFTPIYVYYKEGGEEPIPLYCDNSERSDMQEIYKVLKNMMFVLSFHPKHSGLRNIRKEISQFS
jgi:hypothetical protein